MPFIEETRRQFGSNCNGTWESPYVIGFLTNLITLVAMEAADPDPNDALGLVQSESWQALTGVSAHLIGEKISLLSMAENEDFYRGRGNAARFFDALIAHRSDMLQLPTQAGTTTYGSSLQQPSSTLTHLWNELLFPQVPTPLGGG